MPIRILLTGAMGGPDVGATLQILEKAKEVVTEKAGLVSLDERIGIIRKTDWAQVVAQAVVTGSSEKVEEIA